VGRLRPAVPAPIARTVTTVAGAMVEPARHLVGETARRALAGPPRQRTELAFATETDPGWFGPDSMAWRIHADRSMLVGGLRALFLQVLHPLAMAGVAQHSSYRADPLGRLARTGRFVAATTYGTRAEAERAVATVRGIHDRVRGTASDGRPYEANDPLLLAWVHNVEVDSFLAAYRRYGARPLAPADADRYVSEMATVARRLGAEDLPETAAELTGWIDDVPDLAMTSEARAAIRFLVLPNLPRPMLPTYAVIAAAAADLLSFRRRVALGLWPVPFADPLVVRPAATSLLAVLGWALGPPPLPAGAHDVGARRR
jgi:uncharacterized protein (DUF2236 family)